MDIFEMAMARALAGGGNTGGGGGGTVDGLVIKTIEFTDRQAAQNWFAENSEKVLKTNVYMGEMPAPLVFTDIVAIDAPNVSFVRFDYAYDQDGITITVQCIRLTESGLVVEQGEVGVVPEQFEIPEEDWEPMGIKFTVYYVD